ncbi:MAG: HDOD domain-containing protein [Ruminococcaceae bacterium]|nr:HDOD domain-containing protein [Oscillospiraceae bacterium]
MGCVACQPILNINKQVFGYELLYRSNSSSTMYDAGDGNDATRELLDTAFGDVGIKKITNGHKSFVNFTYDLLVEGIPMLFSKDILIVEVLETVEPTQELLDACRALKKGGYMIALDDFVFKPEYKELMQLADIIKIDFVQMSEREELKMMVKRIKRTGSKVLLAEKVETLDDFELARSLGFVLFQGYFFSRPKLHAGQHLSPQNLSRLQLIRLINQRELDFPKIADVIKRDVILSHKLLRIVNSAYYGLSISITGILHALTILGTTGTRKWISFAILQDSRGESERVLSRMALERGLFMEDLALRIRRKKDKEMFFLFGLFSLADVLMEAPMEEIMAHTNLSPVLTNQLISGEGEQVEMLGILTSFERGDWESARECAAKYGLDEETVSKMYLNALNSAYDML